MQDGRAAKTLHDVLKLAALYPTPASALYQDKSQVRLLRSNSKTAFGVQIWGKSQRFCINFYFESQKVIMRSVPERGRGVLQVQPFVDETEVAVAPDDAATDDAVAEGSGLALPLLGGADVDLEDDDDDLASLLGYGGGDAFASGDEGSESRPLPPLEIKKALDFELPVGEGQWNDAELERVVRVMDAHFGEMPAPPAVDNSEPLDAPGAPGISGDDDTGPSGAER
ncbi:unnamed protein product [Polarella glacialis]|uniref:Uncharacterized protein n=1 Tax=Polarella glacialis TaxID=89957 RepID=A0A813L9W8_POLGL|nr:unnamed protein product [Polarella glacialis]